MKILIVSSRPPWPPKMADAMTVDRLIRFLVERGHEVELACFVESEEQQRELQQGLGEVCASIHTVMLTKARAYANTLFTLGGKLPMQVQYYRSGEMRRTIERLVESGGFDLIYTHLIRMAEYTRNAPIPKVMGVQISQALNLGRMVAHSSDPLRKLFYRIETAKVRPYEADVCADFDRVFLCGPSDIEAIENTAPVPNAIVCPHGQDVPTQERVAGAVREPGAIVITGVMSTYTNVDAATWFAEEVFPRVEAAIPDASFWVVGRNPQRALRALARPPRVLVTGEVPDVYDWLCRAEIAVAPLRIGAGMQNKVVQAMACELPVVATSVANEGIGGTPDDHILLRDDAAGMANTIIELLRDADARRTLGAAARRFVEANWTWEAHFLKLEQVLYEVANNRDDAEALAANRAKSG
jgi:sugar transferase (PEP-CTERM/EpsH1 system associated)